LSKRLIAVATVVTALTAGGQTAHAGGPVKTKLITSFQAGSVGSQDLFVVEVQSKDADCADGRKVTVYEVRQGKDRKVGADKSFAGKGDTYVAVIDSLGTPPGKYYASVKDTNACKGAKSKTVTVG
jgi:hypothetical protein